MVATGPLHAATPLSEKGGAKAESLDQKAIKLERVASRERSGLALAEAFAEIVLVSPTAAVVRPLASDVEVAAPGLRQVPLNDVSR